jgi:hypothetical protein
MNRPAPITLLDARYDASADVQCALVTLDAAPDELAGPADYFVLGIALGVVLSFGLVLSFVASWLRQLDQNERALDNSPDGEELEA